MTLTTVIIERTERRTFQVEGEVEHVEGQPPLLLLRAAVSTPETVTDDWQVVAAGPAS